MINLSHIIRHKQPERDRLARDVDRYLSSGGSIEHLPVTASSGAEYARFNGGKKPNALRRFFNDDQDQ